MAIFILKPFPKTSKVRLTCGEQVIEGFGDQQIEVEINDTVAYKVSAEQCTEKESSVQITSNEQSLEVSLSYIGAVNVDTIVPATGRDTFPTHLSNLGKGGWHIVESLDNRNRIPDARMSEGMAVYVTNEKKLYIYQGELENPETHIVERQWIEFKPSAGDVAWGSITGSLSDQTDLNTILTSLEGRDRFIAFWNAETGLSGTTFEEGFTYNIGDYYIVSNAIQPIKESLNAIQTVGTQLSNIEIDIETYKEKVSPIDDTTFTYSVTSEGTEEKKTWKVGDEDVILEEYGITYTGEAEDGNEIKALYVSPTFNYKPYGTSYVVGQSASTIVETDEVAKNDVYYFDGTNWNLQINHGKAVTFANLEGNPNDNSALKTALDAKQDLLPSGNTGQVLKKTTDGVEWGDISSSEVDYSNTKYTSVATVQDMLDQIVDDEIEFDYSTTKEVGGLPKNTDITDWTLSQLLKQILAPTAVTYPTISLTNTASTSGVAGSTHTFAKDTVVATISWSAGTSTNPGTITLTGTSKNKFEIDGTNVKLKADETFTAGTTSALTFGVSRTYDIIDSLGHKQTNQTVSTKETDGSLSYSATYPSYVGTTEASADDFTTSITSALGLKSLLGEYAATKNSAYTSYTIPDKGKDKQAEMLTYTNRLVFINKGTYTKIKDASGDITGNFKITTKSLNLEGKATATYTIAVLINPSAGYKDTITIS